MLNRLFKKEEISPEKEKERVTLSVIIFGTLFIFGILLLTLMSIVKK